ncbi:hypothetical protein PoB_007700700 [Plakobranchus ocellatus]|uniref:Uncharacterized protein n=1 Tax=Plakobranchus ocellatus TaxID=259542 RepID=A0AAV4E1Q6_9GAST|nr:hypothetical protein PoB_007700700 [Plakobranchus ocellatus]
MSTSLSALEEARRLALAGSVPSEGSPLETQTKQGPTRAETDSVSAQTHKRDREFHADCNEQGKEDVDKREPQKQIPSPFPSSTASSSLPSVEDKKSHLYPPFSVVLQAHDLSLFFFYSFFFILTRRPLPGTLDVEYFLGCSFKTCHEG